jgi:hypothetical protein
MTFISSTVESGLLGVAPESDDKVLKLYKSASRPRRVGDAHPSLPPYGCASLEPLGAPVLGATAITAVSSVSRLMGELWLEVRGISWQQAQV